MWMLFVIVLQSDAYFVAPKGPFKGMEECFEARSRTLATFPKPKIKYEAVCIQTDTIGV